MHMFIGTKWLLFIFTFVSNIENRNPMIGNCKVHSPLMDLLITRDRFHQTTFVIYPEMEPKSSDQLK